MLVCAPWVLSSVLAAAAASPESLDLSSAPADVDLVELLWTRSPDLVAARARLGQADRVRREF